MDGPVISILNNGSATPYEHTNVTLSCNITYRLYGNPVMYEWTKDGDSNKTLENQTMLHLPGIKRTDSGTYRCAVKVAAYAMDKKASQNLTVYCK